MLIRRIKGCTQTIGADQGYLGLPIRRVMKPTVINDVTYTLAHTESAWEPTPAELKQLNEGASIITSQLTFGQPVQPLHLYVEATESPMDDEGEIVDVLAALGRVMDFYKRVLDEQTAHMTDSEDRPHDLDLYQHTIHRLDIVSAVDKELRKEFTDDQSETH